MLRTCHRGPMSIVKETGKQQRKARIVVGVDGSGSSNGPLLWAARQAELMHASLEVVLVWRQSLMAEGYAVAAQPGAGPGSRAKQTLDATIHRVLGEPDGLEVVPIVTRGPVAKTLLRLAKGADLLVLEARGHTTLHRHAGGVSQHTVQEMPRAQW